MEVALGLMIPEFGIDPGIPGIGPGEHRDQLRYPLVFERVPIPGSLLSVLQDVLRQQGLQRTRPLAMKHMVRAGIL